MPVHIIKSIFLKKIFTGQNALHELPDSFCKLKSLKVCQMSKNKIQILPSEFGDLSALEDLRLDNNLVIIFTKMQRIFFEL